ncbi:MAG: dioxygenase [Sphingopyxis sp.]|nr:dioxygenase [Sphingopyxis sp.]
MNERIPTEPADTPRLPALFLSHGGGPCFFLEPGERFPAGTWDRMGQHLTNVPQDVGASPSAILIVSAHWEEETLQIYSPDKPKLYFDYYGFPQRTYEFSYPVSGDPILAGKTIDMLNDAGFPVSFNRDRGYDHGVFIPLMLAYPQAQIPVVQLSLLASHDPEDHIAIGRALAPLREEGVLIVGSGMSYHNLRAFGSNQANADASAFDDWLRTTIASPDLQSRAARLGNWAKAPGAVASHPRAEHLAPLFVAAGAGHDENGRNIYRDAIFGKAVSSFAFG